MKLYEFADDISDEDRLTRINECLDKMSDIMGIVAERRNVEENESTRNREKDIRVV